MTRPPSAAARASVLRRGVSRRRFLASSAGILGAAAGAAIAGCGDSKQPDQHGSPSPSAPAPLRAAVGTRGGILRTYNFDAMQYDTLDPHLTQIGPIVNAHSAIFSKLLRYEDERANSIVPDLAAAMPEQPDQTTYVFRLREGVTFHDAPKYRMAYPRTAGRALTADDMKYSIERQTDKSSPQSRRFFRQSDWSVIDKIEAQDAHTLVIRTKTPVAPFLGFLAGRHAFVLPKEVLDRNDEITSDLALIGTGPFMLDSFEPQVAVRLRRNAAWFARDDDRDGSGEGRPFLDGYDAFYTPQEDTFQRVAFERRIVDETGFVDPVALDQERKTNLADIAMLETDGGGFLASRLLLDRPPFKDDRIRRALHLAIDRGALVSLLYPEMDGRPSAKLAGAIAPAMPRWAIAEDDLKKRPGYRADTAGRAEDIATAKQLWSAATGEKDVSDLHISVAGVPRTIAERAVDALRRQLQDALGVNVIAQADPSGHVLIASALMRNLEGATDGVVPFTLALEDGSVDLDGWLYPHFRSGQSMNTYRLQDPQLDAMLDKSRGEFDEDARRKLGIDIQNYLLSKVNARLEICAPMQRRLSWGYVRNPHVPIWYGSNDRIADTWLDTTHPAWRPRPT